MCREFASQMKINVWLRQGGYLFLARTAASRETLEKSVALQNECGLATRMLSPQEAQRIVPELDVDGVQAASYNPDDGVVFPWPFVWGYAQAARKLGVEVIDWHDVVGFDTRGPAIDRCARAPIGSAGPRRRRSAGRHHRDEPRRQRRGRVVARDRAHARRRPAEQAPPPRDLLERAAQAVAQAAGRRPLRRPLLLAVDARRDRRRHRQRVRPARARPGQLTRVPRSLRELAPARVPGARIA